MDKESLKQKLNESSKNKKAEFHSAAVWIFAGLSLVAYSVIGLLNTSIPGVEDLVAFLSSVEGKYIYLAAFISIFIEGLYFVGSFFPGSTMVVILAILSQLVGPLVFIATIFTIFLGWCLAGAFNILFAKIYHLKIARLQEDDEYKIKNRFWTTWFPAFRANYEVSQVTNGGNPFKVFLSSIKVKFLVTIVAALGALIVPLFIDIQKVGNQEGFLTVVAVATISFAVGAVKIKKI